MTLNQDAAETTSILSGKTVKRVKRFREHEVLIEFEDGSRLFVDSAAALELSITLSGPKPMADG